MNSNGGMDEKRVKSRGSSGSGKKWRGITTFRGGSSKMSEDGVATCNYLCQDKTQRKYRNTLDSLKKSFFTSKFNVIYNREDTLFIVWVPWRGREEG